jgi:hypothetical protein
MPKCSHPPLGTDGGDVGAGPVGRGWKGRWISWLESSESSRELGVSYLVFLASKTLQITPGNLIHRIWRLVSRESRRGR